MALPKHHQPVKIEQNQLNGTFFALKLRVVPGMSFYLTEQLSRDFQRGEAQQRPNGLLHISVLKNSDRRILNNARNSSSYPTESPFQPDSQGH